MILFGFRSLAEEFISVFPMVMPILGDTCGVLVVVRFIDVPADGRIVGSDETDSLVGAPVYVERGFVDTTVGIHAVCSRLLYHVSTLRPTKKLCRVTKAVA